MAQQELRPAWCGSLPNAFTTPKPGFLYWSEDRGWLVFCCQECLCAVRRVGWHAKREPPPIPYFTVSTSALEDLDKERSESRDERNRLARKVNALLGKLQDERAKTNYAENKLRVTENTLLAGSHERCVLATENESLRDALEDLGQKNDGLVMQVAELSGDLEDSRRWNDEERFKHDHERAALLGRIVESFRARAILEGFVFEVLDQYAESQQQLASNR